MGTTVACTGPMTQHRSLCLKHQNIAIQNVWAQQGIILGILYENELRIINMYCNIFFRPLHIMKTHCGMTCSLISLPISTRNRTRKRGNTNSSSVVSGDSLPLCSWDGPAVWSMDSTSVATGISLVTVSMSEGGSPASKLFMWAPLQYLHIPDKHMILSSNWSQVTSKKKWCSDKLPLSKLFSCTLFIDSKIRYASYKNSVYNQSTYIHTYIHSLFDK